MQEINHYFLSFVFGILPPILWLSFYLREDQRPEPKRMVIFVFILGILFVFPAVLLEYFFLEIFSFLNIPEPYLFFLKNFFVIAFLEELFKFLPIFFFVFKSKEFDEPVDGMIYMIISALGFAACENFFAIFNLHPQQFQFPQLYFSSIIFLALLRFLGPVFLHSLSSAIFGFFVSLYYFKKRKIFTLLLGLFLASLLHFAFNFSIILIVEEKKFSFAGYYLIILFLAGIGILVHSLFQRLKK
jgi:RsiW-degrading membrane proteinase PrsW (M82 family)